MLFKLPSTYLKPSTAGLDPSISLRADKLIFGCFTRNVPERKYRFKLVGLSMGDKWPLNDIDASEFVDILSKDFQFQFLSLFLVFLVNCLINYYLCFSIAITPCYS